MSAVAVTDGRDEAKSTEASVYFPSNEVVVGVHADDKAVPLVLPRIKVLEEIHLEGNARVCEVLFFVDEVSLVLTVH